MTQIIDVEELFDQSIQEYERRPKRYGQSVADSVLRRRSVARRRRAVVRNGSAVGRIESRSRNGWFQPGVTVSGWSQSTKSPTVFRISYLRPQAPNPNPPDRRLWVGRPRRMDSGRYKKGHGRTVPGGKSPTTRCATGFSGVECSAADAIDTLMARRAPGSFGGAMDDDDTAVSRGNGAANDSASTTVPAQATIPPLPLYQRATTRRWCRLVSTTTETAYFCC
jgi:hypothetical protein